MRKLNRVRATDWKGQTFDEELPERLILIGPNGSGKTSRLEAIRFALRPPTNKAGFAPYMTTAHTEIAVGSDGEQVIRSCRRGLRKGVPTYKMEHRCEPSMGERSKTDVDKRLQDSFQIEPFVLDLESFFGDSAPGRRRSLLDLLEPVATTTAEMVRTRLDERLGSNCAWPELRDAIPKREGVSAIDWLKMAEEMARARSSLGAEELKGLQARLRTPEDESEDESPQDADTLEAMIQTLDTEIEEQEAVAAAARERVAARRLIVSRIENAKRGLPDEIVNAADRAKAIATLGGAALRVHTEAKAVQAKCKETKQDAGSKWGDAKNALASIGGRLTQLRRMRDAWAADEDQECPFCGNVAPDLADAVRDRIVTMDGEHARAEQDDKRAAYAEQDALHALSIANIAVNDARKSVDASERAVAALVPLSMAEAELRDHDAIAGPVPVEGQTDGLRARRESNVAELRLSSRLVERSEAVEKDRGEAARLVVEGERVREILAAVGPKGEQGDLLAEMLEPINHAIGMFEANGRNFGLRLEDERGGADAMLTLGDAPYQSMSGGERAIGIAALATAVATARRDRTACLLIEAGEVDEANLIELCVALAKLEVSNAVIATHVRPAHMHSADWDALGWTVRTLG